MANSGEQGNSELLPNRILSDAYPNEVKNNSKNIKDEGNTARNAARNAAEEAERRAAEAEAEAEAEAKAERMADDMEQKMKEDIRNIIYYLNETIEYVKRHNVIPITNFSEKCGAFVKASNRPSGNVSNRPSGNVSNRANGNAPKDCIVGDKIETKKDISKYHNIKLNKNTIGFIVKQINESQDTKAAAEATAEAAAEATAEADDAAKNRIRRIISRLIKDIRIAKVNPFPGLGENRLAKDVQYKKNLTKVVNELLEQILIALNSHEDIKTEKLKQFINEKLNRQKLKIKDTDNCEIEIDIEEITNLPDVPSGFNLESKLGEILKSNLVEKKRIWFK
jgi:hypothetical protein